MNARRLSVRAETWPIAGRFTISRGSKTSAEVIVAEIRAGEAMGRGECVPYARYGESVPQVVAAIEAFATDIAGGLDRAGLQSRLPAGAARNALDCALWDLDAKLSGASVWELAGLDAPESITTAYTLSLDSPEVMGAAARDNAGRPLLKVKLGRDGVVERLRAVREGAPAARLIVDANEAWAPEFLTDVAPELADLGIEMIEQPLPASRDAALAGMDCPVPLCADESCHDRASLAGLDGRYDMINVKLDKTGGLTEALALATAAAAAGLGVMVGCMIGTSLAMAPAMIVAARARIVDLDGPLLLARDREPGIVYRESLMAPPPRELWG